METQNEISWEYKVIVCEAKSFGRLQVILINGDHAIKVEREVNTALFGTKMEKTKDNPYLYEYLQEQGNQGWEVCSSSTYPEGSVRYVHIIMKRLNPRK